MPENNKKKEFLQYEDGEIKPKIEEKIESPPENIDEYIDNDESLDPIADILKNIDKEIENPETDIESNIKHLKRKKQYIELSEHKHAGEESWLDVKSKDDTEDNNSDEIDISEDKKETKKFELPFKITPYYAIVGLMVILLVVFLFFNRNTTTKSPVVNNPYVTTNPNNVIQKEPSMAELSELSSLALEYTEAIKTMSELRTSELKVTYGYIDGTYTKKQLNNLISQSTLKKDNLLTKIDGENVSSAFSNLKTLAARFVRAELNASKQVLSDIQTSQKANDIYTKFSGTTSSINEHITNLCNELESLLKSYNISYSRSGNTFLFD